MGKQAARLGDICTGHSCWPPRLNVAASDNVIINGRGAHRVGDGWAVHCCLNKCHAGALAQGSATVIVNGRSAGRVGDPVSCGSAVASGSNNVLIGG